MSTQLTACSSFKTPIPVPDDCKNISKNTYTFQMLL